MGLNGSEVLNDSPVDCQTRGVPEPQREGDRHWRWMRMTLAEADEVSEKADCRSG